MRYMMNRRRVVQSISGVIPGSLLASQEAFSLSKQNVAEAIHKSLGKSREKATYFLNLEEMRSVSAIVDRLIPDDALGPGALAAGVPGFIDRQLASAWGHGDHFYRSPPFVPGTPQQGYQLALTPSEVIREGLVELKTYIVANYKKTSFEDLSTEAQDKLLHMLEKGQIEFEVVPTKIFFDTILELTFEGFFSDPQYGGNADKVGWRLIGFPGTYANYSVEIEKHGMLWDLDPLSIQENSNTNHHKK